MQLRAAARGFFQNRYGLNAGHSGHRSRSGDSDELGTMEIIRTANAKGVSASAEEEPNNERDI